MESGCWRQNILFYPVPELEGRLASPRSPTIITQEAQDLGTGLED